MAPHLQLVQLLASVSLLRQIRDLERLGHQVAMALLLFSDGLCLDSCLVHIGNPTDTGAAPSFGFGASQPAASAAFGQAASSQAAFGFGQPQSAANAGFGFSQSQAPASGGFGQPQSAAGSSFGFGQSAPASAGFGQPQSAASTGFEFGQPQSGANIGFGQPQSAASTGFGQPSTAASGGFGQPQPASGGFGFGQTPANGGFNFGTAQSAPAMFGQTQSASTAAAAAPAFGANVSQATPGWLPAPTVRAMHTASIPCMSCAFCAICKPVLQIFSHRNEQYINPLNRWQVALHPYTCCATAAMQQKQGCSFA